MERNSDNDCIGCIELWFVFFLSNRNIISGLLRFQKIIWLSRIYITNSISGLCVEHIKIWSIDVFSLLFRKKNIYEKRCVENCGLRRMVTSLRRLSYVLICMVQEALACLNIFILAFHFMTFQFFTCFTSAVWYYLPSVFFVIFVPILKMTLFIQLLEIRIERRFIWI